eukprot:8264912-Pyramimonas_sp.AAC.1
MAPQRLSEAAWLGHVNGAAISSAAGAARISERVIDYFVVSPCRASATATALFDWDFGPHRPVLLEIATQKVQPWIQ